MNWRYIDNLSNREVMVHVAFAFLAGAVLAYAGVTLARFA